MHCAVKYSFTLHVICILLHGGLGHCTLGGEVLSSILLPFISSPYTNCRMSSAQEGNKKILMYRDRKVFIALSLQVCCVVHFLRNLSDRNKDVETCVLSTSARITIFTFAILAPGLKTLMLLIRRANIDTLDNFAVFV